jgi:antitoxin component YwqK of YwqJK toxin-antitoxin module
LDGGMKKLLAALFVALLMVGCGDPDLDDAQKPGEDSSESNQTSAEPLDAKTAEVPKIDLDDPETLDEIIAGATVGDELEQRGKEGEGLSYARNEQKPYTGWNVIFHDNGQIKYLVQYKDGKYDGLWVRWFENGQKNLEENYKDGELHGLVTVWYDNGQKKWEGNWKDGKKVGLQTGWYENGQKRKEVTYKAGKKISEKQWDEDGNPMGQDQGGEAPKVVVDYYKLSQGDGLFYFEEKPFTGVAISKYGNGKKGWELNYKDGKLDGPSTDWHLNGQKRVERNYKDGKDDGLYTWWYENGQKRKEDTYKDGKKDGRWNEWYENGQKERECNYKNVKLISAEVWKPNGKKCPVTNLKDGNGVVVYCNYDGTVDFHRTYKNGEPVFD